MGQKRDEILKKTREAQEAEKHRKDLEAFDSKPARNMTSWMPLGCWIWISLLGFAIYLLLKKAGVV
jgi:hypothetical protein